MLLGAIEHLLSEVFYLDRVHLSWSFSYKKQVFLGAVLSVSIRISRFPVFFGSKYGLFEAKRKPREPITVPFLGE